jgi:hypothetical protein
MDIPEHIDPPNPESFDGAINTVIPAHTDPPMGNCLPIFRSILPP